MSFPPTPPEITAPAAPEATDASKPAPGAPEAATPAPTPSNPPADHSPQSAPVAPSAAPATAPSAPDTAGMKDELSKRDEARKRLDSMFEPYAPLLWVIELFIYIYFTALAVSLMSFSYKALKGYEANEPIPAEE
jgi:hypothetical protein